MTTAQFHKGVENVIELYKSGVYSKEEAIEELVYINKSVKPEDGLSVDISILDKVIVDSDDDVEDFRNESAQATSTDDDGSYDDSSYSY